jgi:hypothetical protein
MNTTNRLLRLFIAMTIVSVTCFTNLYGQGKVDKSFRLMQIRQIFRQINNYKDYKVVAIEDSEEFTGHVTDNGGSLKGFYKGDSLKKIVEWVGLSNRVVQTEYYFDKGKLVFVFTTDKCFKFNAGTEKFDYSQFDKVSNSRYYFSNDRLIDTIINDKEKEKTKQQDAKVFLDLCREFRKLLDKRRK